MYSFGCTHFFIGVIFMNDKAEKKEKITAYFALIVAYWLTNTQISAIIIYVGEPFLTLLHIICSFYERKPQCLNQLPFGKKQKLSRGSAHLYTLVAI